MGERIDERTHDRCRLFGGHEAHTATDGRSRHGRGRATRSSLHRSIDQAPLRAALAYDRAMRARAIAVVVVAACASASPATNAPTTAAASSTASVSTAATGAPLPDLLLPSEPTSGGSAPVNVKPPPKEAQPACGSDQDCWSITCCPATNADECVHHSLAQKCAIVDVRCPKLDAHVDCVCEAGVCTGRAP